MRVWRIRLEGRRSSTLLASTSLFRQLGLLRRSPPLMRTCPANSTPDAPFHQK